MKMLGADNRSSKKSTGIAKLVQASDLDIANFL
jgi:hypothetical protein